MNYIRKHWKKILCITAALAFFPFVLERILFITPIVSEFSNEVWFSFIGSYIGSVVTLVVMFITFKKVMKKIKNCSEDKKDNMTLMYKTKNCLK